MLGISIVLSVVLKLLLAYSIVVHWLYNIHDFFFDF